MTIGHQEYDESQDTTTEEVVETEETTDADAPEPTVDDIP